MQWHYQMTGAFDPFWVHELTLWRREHFRAMHALLLTRIRVGRQLNGYQCHLCHFSADSPEDHLVAQLPPPYEQ